MTRLTISVALATLFGLVATTSADRQIAPGVGVRVSGTVVDAYAGVTPAPIWVTLMKQLGSVGFGAPLRRADVRSDRDFAFDGVEPGTYQLATTLGSELMVTVGTEDVSGLRLRHVGLTELFPSMRMDDGADVPPDMGVHIADGDGQILSAGVRHDRSLLLPPGRRFFFVQPPDGVYVHSVVSAGVDLLKEPLNVEPVASERGIQIVLTRLAPTLATVRGRVSGGAGPLTVQLTSAFLSRRTHASATAHVAPDGSFELEIEPGVYDVHVPPAVRVVPSLVVPYAGTTVDVRLPAGRLFAGGGVRVLDTKGQSVPYSFGPVVLAARSGARVSRFPVEVRGFWGALPPGEYRLALENLPPGTSVATLEAGGRDLLTLPYLVSADRNPPRITLVLRYSGPVPSWVDAPPRSLQEILGPAGAR